MERFLFTPRSGLGRIAIYGAVFASLVVLSLLEQRVSVPWEAAATIFGLAFVPLVAAAALGFPRSRRVVEVLEDRLHVPYGSRALRTIAVRYAELEAVHLSPGPGGALLLVTPHARIRLPSASFDRPTDAARLHELVRARVEAIIPNGPARLAKIDEGSRAAILAETTRPVAAFTVAVGFVVAHLVAHLFGAFDRLYAAVPAGAGVRVLVEEGQWFRVVSASLLHSNLFHLALVVVLVLVFGARVERLFGARHTLLVMLAALVAGGIASAVSFGDVVYMGGQTIGCGLLGAVAFVTTKYRGRLPHELRAGAAWWLVAIALASFLVLVSPLLWGSDISGQLGGLLAGVLVSALVLLRGDPKLPQRTVTPFATGLVVALGLAFFAAVAATVYRASTAGADDETRVIRHHLDESVGPHLLNRLAWEVAIDPDAKPDRIALARTASERSLERVRSDESRAAYEDTYATLLYRQGDAEGAIRHEVLALGLRDDPIMATQLARFIRRAGTVVHLRGATAGDVRVETVEHEVRGVGVRLYGVTATTATTLYAIAKNGQRLEGVLRMSVDPATPQGETIWLQKRGAPEAWPAGVSLTIGAVDRGHSEWRAWSIAPEILEYP